MPSLSDWLTELIIAVILLYVLYEIVKSLCGDAFFCKLVSPIVVAAAAGVYAYAKLGLKR